jgi:hypothetical protein
MCFDFVGFAFENNVTECGNKFIAASYMVSLKSVVGIICLLSVSVIFF